MSRTDHLRRRETLDSRRSSIRSTEGALESTASAGQPIAGLDHWAGHRTPLVDHFGRIGRGEIVARRLVQDPNGRVQHARLKGCRITHLGNASLREKG